MNRKTLLTPLAGLLLLAALPSAFGETSPNETKITFNEFLAEVACSNLDFAAQRYNVSIAEAQLVAAKVSPNPVLQLGYGRDITHEQQPTTYSVGITQAIETGRKRSLRTAAARRDLMAANATLEDFFNSLRATAANAFIDALYSTAAAEQKCRSAETLDSLVKANAKRLEAGDIGEVDLRQSKVDALLYRSESLAAQAEARSAILALSGLIGPNPKHCFAELVPAGQLEKIPLRKFGETALIRDALARRADIRAARHILESAEARVRLARANRLPDVEISASVEQATRTLNQIDPTPNFNNAAFTLSVPLPLFNSFRGEYKAAVQTALQARKALQAAELKAQVEIRQAFAVYGYAQRRVAAFQDEALGDAEKVLKAKLFSYQQGEATLLDVLAAHREANEVRLSYYEALAARAKALVALEQAAYLWDVEL